MSFFLCVCVCVFLLHVFVQMSLPFSSFSTRHYWKIFSFLSASGDIALLVSLSVRFCREAVIFEYFGLKKISFSFLPRASNVEKQRQPIKNDGKFRLSEPHLEKWLTNAVVYTILSVCVTMCVCVYKLEGNKTRCYGVLLLFPTTRRHLLLAIKIV